MNNRLNALKTVLWAIVGVLAVVTLVRFFRGLGATTALNDATPWGFWIAFDVMAGVALAAGGFVVAATVYIFGRKKYHGFARPAILTAFLGYAAVATGLLYDLGLPWNIWHPFVHPQPNSVLFEVAMCVGLYLTVLLLEFSPVILEHPLFDRPFFRRIHKFLKKAAIPLVITGIVLSTLHQSSLGSLFLIAPYRVDPLWYSPIIWILFFISAVGLGLMMVVAESYFSAWAFGHRLRMDRLAGFGKAAAIVLILYAGLRIGDLAVRGDLGAAFDGTWQSVLFLFEILLSAVVPATLLLIPRIRSNPIGLGVCSGMVVMGMIGYRFDVCIVAFARPEGMSYFPSWTELAVSVGIVAVAMLIFIFFVERLRVYEPEEEDQNDKAPDIPNYSPESTRSFLPNSLAWPRRFSLAAIGAAALALALLPQGALFGEQLKETRVNPSRTVQVQVFDHESGAGHEFAMAQTRVSPPSDQKLLAMLMIDGNRDGRLVLFHHEGHVATHGGGESCRICHHQNKPFDKNTSCHECHRDMYKVTDVFDHSSHVGKLGGGVGCRKCHQDPDKVKSRETTVKCGECHQAMLVEGSMVSPCAGESTGMAPGYMDAMHGVCLGCHQRMAKERPTEFHAGFAECASCHRDMDAEKLRAMKPYVSEE